jgi:hypothetical protein
MDIAVGSSTGVGRAVEFDLAVVGSGSATSAVEVASEDWLSLTAFPPHPTSNITVMNKASFMRMLLFS